MRVSTSPTVSCLFPYPPHLYHNTITSYWCQHNANIFPDWCQHDHKPMIWLPTMTLNDSNWQRDPKLIPTWAELDTKTMPTWAKSVKTIDVRLIWNWRRNYPKLMPNWAHGLKLMPGWFQVSANTSPTWSPSQAELRVMFACAIASIARGSFRNNTNELCAMDAITHNGHDSHICTLMPPPLFLA
jgi:hypothetical protein